MSMKGAFVPLEALERWLNRMETDWKLIDDEWGRVEGGLDGDIARGHEVEIPELRKYVEQAKNS